MWALKAVWRWANENPVLAGFTLVGALAAIFKQLVWDYLLGSANDWLATQLAPVFGRLSPFMGAAIPYLISAVIVVAILALGIAIERAMSARRKLPQTGGDTFKASVTVLPKRKSSHPSVVVHAAAARVSFDYSTHNGVVAVGNGDCEFRLAFSKASDTCIHMMSGARTRRSNLKRLARAKGIQSGEKINIDQFDSTSSHYNVRTGEHFLAENDKGYFMQGKIVSLKDDSRGADHDEIVFEYQIDLDGSAEFTAL